MANGRFREARLVLLRARANQPDDPEILFLLGQIAFAQKDYAAAIGDYRRVLVSHPNVARVRLELARSFFEAGDDDNAERQFRFVLAGDLPGPVTDRVHDFLDQIHQRRSWSYRFTLGVAPDTNYNAAPSIRQVQLFGLPFELDEAARQKSGIGLLLNTGGEYDWALSPDLRWRFAANGTRLDYPDNRFDDSSVEGFTGPKLLLGKWDVSVLATSSMRWLGKTPYDHGAGGRIEADYGVDQRLLLGGNIELFQTWYHQVPEQTGAAGAVNFFANYALTPSSIVTGNFGVTRVSAEVPWFRYTGLRAAGGLGKELPLGITAYVQGEVDFAPYDGLQPLFEDRRNDLTGVIRLDLSDRRIDVYGFTPVIKYAFIDNQSSVAYYSFRRHQVQLAVTRLF